MQLELSDYFSWYLSIKITTFQDIKKIYKKNKVQSINKFDSLRNEVMNRVSFRYRKSRSVEWTDEITRYYPSNTRQSASDTKLQSELKMTENAKHDLKITFSLFRKVARN